MKSPKKIPILVSAILLLCSCVPFHSSSAGDSTKPNDNTGTTIDSGSSDTSSESSSVSSEDTSSSSQEVNSGVFQFYCVNDFHGAIIEGYDGNRYEAGIKKYFSKLAKLREADPEHTILLSAGDMYQGSLESNINYGALVTEAMNVTGFEAMTIGNHEWDYGPERLKDNIKLARFPVLAGNIVDYHDHSLPWDGGSQISTIIEKAGVKIGVVGMIGFGQTTSITAKHVQDLDFINPEPLAIAEAERLKKQEGCKLTLLVIHDDADAVLGWEKEKELGNYFDGVFCGHTHKRNLTVHDGVPLVQSYNNGRAISHIEITLKEGAAKASKWDILQADPSWENSGVIDQVYDKYLNKEEYTSKAHATAGVLSEALDNLGVARLGTKAIYEKYHKEQPTLACAIENKQRATLPEGRVSYSQLYKCTPFTNNIVLMNVLGSEIKRQAKYSVIYVGDPSLFANLNDDQTYLVAVIDYLAYHQDTKKRYNYFPGLNSGEDTIVKEYEDYPMDISFEYLKTLGEHIDASLFDAADPHYGSHA